MKELSNSDKFVDFKRPSWLNRETYNKVCKDIDTWPEWKKEAYNQFYSMRCKYDN